ncbi:MAG: hypothetical protein US40_C0011G0042 [Candidatus Roizmanbacteria bacterium GW2011_GWC2_37_13]|uniref:Large ribosomal subunit protein uL1 n=1 Tax=Candidatus Roizmanbacteria bacterium GW2011_GWC2_37_13 TaxID=1618486 RepID=A0A0G0G555_9BACT|nr:MAG: hypothetical protein US38_C0007G0042 [Candidatus Roizmanbacteria bacterium GW2011_GWC1_37_12]KKQ25157.1 MAG: hypothetical protein US40_C0011G0042 [Candidatus Roizmanbacteria bacterium GW2011_GWC2_37_13]
MGKVKTRLLGLEEIEEKQKKEQKEKAAQKKAVKKKEEPKKEAEIKVEKPKDKKTQKIQTKSRGKKYLEVKKLVDKTKTYSLKDAVALLKKMKTSKFDESVELHLIIDETGLKGEVDLPFSTGKIVKVAVVDDKVLEAIEKGKLDFDILVTHPSFMPRLAKFAKVLGPKGLMPNPKAGTISPNPEDLVKKFAKGLLRWKTEAKFPLIHQMIGKVSFDEKNLIANAEKFLSSVGSKHILKAFIKSTMSPSIKLEIRF